MSTESFLTQEDITELKNGFSALSIEQLLEEEEEVEKVINSMLKKKVIDQIEIDEFEAKPEEGKTTGEYREDLDGLVESLDEFINGNDEIKFEKVNDNSKVDELTVAMKMIKNQDTRSLEENIEEGMSKTNIPNEILEEILTVLSEVIAEKQEEIDKKISKNFQMKENVTKRDNLIAARDKVQGFQQQAQKIPGTYAENLAKGLGGVVDDYQQQLEELEKNEETKTIKADGSKWTAKEVEEEAKKLEEQQKGLNELVEKLRQSYKANENEKLRLVLIEGHIEKLQKQGKTSEEIKQEVNRIYNKDGNEEITKKIESKISENEKNKEEFEKIKKSIEDLKLDEIGQSEQELLERGRKLREIWRKNKGKYEVEIYDIMLEERKLTNKFNKEVIYTYVDILRGADEKQDCIDIEEEIAEGERAYQDLIEAGNWSDEAEETYNNIQAKLKSELKTAKKKYDESIAKYFVKREIDLEAIKKDIHEQAREIVGGGYKTQQELMDKVKDMMDFCNECERDCSDEQKEALSKYYEEQDTIKTVRKVGWLKTNEEDIKGVVENPNDYEEDEKKEILDKKQKGEETLKTLLEQKIQSLIEEMQDDVAFNKKYAQKIEEYATEIIGLCQGNRNVEKELRNISLSFLKSAFAPNVSMNNINTTLGEIMDICGEAKIRGAYFETEDEKEQGKLKERLKKAKVLRKQLGLTLMGDLRTHENYEQELKEILGKLQQMTECNSKKGQRDIQDYINKTNIIGEELGLFIREAPHTKNKRRARKLYSDTLCELYASGVEMSQMPTMDIISEEMPETEEKTQSKFRRYFMRRYIPYRLVNMNEAGHLDNGEMMKKYESSYDSIQKQEKEYEKMRKIQQNSSVSFKDIVNKIKDKPNEIKDKVEASRNEHKYRKTKIVSYEFPKKQDGPEANSTKTSTGHDMNDGQEPGE